APTTVRTIIKMRSSGPMTRPPLSRLSGTAPAALPSSPIGRPDNSNTARVMRLPVRGKNKANAGHNNPDGTGVDSTATTNQAKTAITTIISTRDQAYYGDCDRSE